MSKGICYYTDNRIDEPIFSLVQKYLLEAELPIVSVSLKPLDFGQNIVLDEKPCYLTMIKQISLALAASDADYVFFCEHDCLYPHSHFNFTPCWDDIFYYNSNVWRWDYPHNRAIRYDRLISLSGLCVNRKFALDHYIKRIEKIRQMGWEEKSHEPDWVRKMGYEPGTKKKKRGGFSDDNFVTWQSEYPIVDIRHNKTFSPPKVSLDSFKHKPTNWQEIKATQIPGWGLRRLCEI